MSSSFKIKRLDFNKISLFNVKNDSLLYKEGECYVCKEKLKKFKNIVKLTYIHGDEVEHHCVCIPCILDNKKTLLEICKYEINALKDSIIDFERSIHVLNLINPKNKYEFINSE